MSENLVRTEFLSKDNITNLYKQTTINNELTNLSKEQKDKIINQLIENMKSVFKTLELNKINQTNISLVKKQFNEIVIKKTSEVIVNKSNTSNNEMNNKMNTRNFESVKRPMPIPGNDRPTGSFGNTQAPAPKNVSTDIIQKINADVGSRLSEIEQSRRINNDRKPTEIPDFLKPVKVGKTNSYDEKPSSGKPLLGFSDNNDSNFSSTVPVVDISKYNDNMSTQDRLKQLEMERSMPNASNNGSVHSQTQNSSLFTSPPPQQYNQPQAQQYQAQQYQAQQPQYQQPQYQQPQYQQPQSQQPQSQQPQSQQQHPQLQDIMEKLSLMTNKMSEMQQVIGNLQRENDYLRNQPQQKKTLTKTFQLEVNKKDSSYNYQFNEINNISKIKLVSYNLPQPVYNIESCSFEYNYQGSNEQSIYINKGFYDITSLLNELNKNDNLIFSIDNSQLVKVSSKNNNNITILNTYLSNKLGFINKNTNNEIIADRIYDLRMPTKLLLYIRNIYNNQPVGVLNFNGNSICELNFNELLSLNNLQLEFYTEDNNLYNFNGLTYNLSFIIEIID